MMENHFGFRGHILVLLCILICTNQTNGQGYPATGLRAAAMRTTPNNRNAVASSRFENRTGTPTVLFSAQQAAFQWFFDNNTYIPNTWTLTSNIANVRFGMWVDSRWDPTVRRAVVCNTDRNIYQWNIDANTAALVYTVTTIVGESGNTLTSCLIDFEFGAAYFGHFRVISKLIISAPGGTWSQQRDSPRRASPGEIRSMALDTKQGYVYFGTGSGELVRIRRNETRDISTAPFDVFGPLGGELITLAVDGISNYMFIGTNFGLGMRFPLGVYGGSYDFFFFGQQRLETILLDEVNKVTYWTTDSSWFYRIDHENFFRYRDATYINCTGFPTCLYTVPLILSGGVMDTTAGVAYVSTANTNPGAGGQIIRIQLYDCSMHSTCGDCVTNNKYCEWCVFTRTCARKSTCGLSPASNSTSTCPNLLAISPSSGSIYGNTTVTVTANIFPNNATRLRCRFDVFNSPILTPVTIIDSGTITCQTPLNYGVATPVDVDILYDTTSFTDSTLNFTFYNCPGTTCGSCYDPLRPECGWCLAEGLCRNSFICGQLDNFAQSTCPVLYGISPNTGEDSGNTLVTITGSYFPITSIVCKFGEYFSNATRVNSTTITCLTPRAAVTGNSIVSVSVVYGIDLSRNYATGNLSFIYFNCDQSRSCSNCIQGSCGWCIDTATCRSVNSTVACSNPVSAINECPRIISVTPNSLYYSDAGVSLTVTGYNILPATVGQYSCRFSNIGDANSTLGVTPATYVNSSTLTCGNVAQVSSGVSYLSVTYQNLFFASEYVPINHYDCSFYSCDQCQDMSRPKCEWCIGSSLCIADLVGCSNETILGTCPPRSHVSGNTTVFVTATQFVSGISYNCDFGGEIEFNNDLKVMTGDVVSAQRLNETTVTCVAPNGTSGNIPFRILNGNFPYTSDTLSFFYFECSDLGLDCQGCLDYPGCVFCLPYTCQSVEESNNCPLGFDTLVCPTLNSISPDHASVGENITVLISGGKFIPNTDYQCGVDTIGNITADFVNGNTLQCVFPAQSQYKIVNVKIYSGGNEYSKDSLSFEFYDCSANSGQSNCSSCSVNPSSYCGWCLYSQSCGTIDLCPNPFGWTPSVCPSIDSAFPTFDSIEGNSTISINGSLFIDGISYECSFGTIRVPASRISDSLLQCRSPATSLRKRQGTSTVSLTVYSGNRQFSSNSFGFDILDCSYSGERLCTSCMNLGNDPRCDWCLVDNKCGPSHRCDNIWGPISDAINCPVLVSMYPLTGNLEENTTVGIQGSLFVDHPTLHCTFGDIFAPATYINNTYIQCVAPPHNETGPIHVVVWVNGDKFTTNFLLFEYVVVEPPLVVSGSPQDILPVTLGTLGAAVALSLIVIVAAILVIRRRRALKKLPEPDYLGLAFAGALPEYDLDRDAAEKLEGLEELLLAPDFGLVTAICDTTQLSDVDQITKAIIYVYESNNHSVDIIKYFITREVQSSDTEGSLFRSNSIVSKMASHYGKMIGKSLCSLNTPGLPYLWRTLALPIHELNDLGSGEVEASKYKTEIGMRSIMTPSSMEVDPTKLDSSEDATVNQLQLMLISQKLFGAITKSVEYLPVRLRQVYRHIKFEVNRKYPAHVQKSVSSFLFLRFICPSILAPHVYGLLLGIFSVLRLTRIEPPNQECQRYLILISKTLQSLANGSLPGKKEDYMQKMNDFITNNTDALRNFIDSVTAPVDADQLSPMALPRGLRFNALAFLYEHIYLHNAQLRKYFEEQPNGRELSERLQALLDRVGSPPQLKK